MISAGDNFPGSSTTVEITWKTIFGDVLACLKMIQVKSDHDALALAGVESVDVY